MVLNDRLKVLVGVYMVRGPLGAMTWHYLQYAAGLARLGHDVTVVEDSDDQEYTCLDPRTGEVGTDPTYGLEYTRKALAPFGLQDRFAYYDVHGGGWTGPARATVLQDFADADLYLNVSGVNAFRSWHAQVPVRVYVDTDPGFVQVRNFTEPSRRRDVEAHNRFLTFGERFGAADCRIPDDGFPWRPTRQPVVLDAWPVTPPRPGAPMTTVLKWDSYRTRALGDLVLGMKSASFDQVLDLPSTAPLPLEMAIGAPYPAKALLSAGWRLRNPFIEAVDPPAFQRYVQSSTGEFTVAKHGYVVTRGGWFSERSAHYLASGRPVVTEETGFSDLLPTGEGLLAFTTRDGAQAALEQVAADPARHGTAAREIAEAHFDSDVVLTRLLEDVA